MIAAWLAVSCSGSPVVTPVGQTSSIGSDDSLKLSGSMPYESNRYLWGYWDVTYDPATQEVTAVPNREAMIHINIRKSLENGQACTTCLVFGDNFINEAGNLELEVGIIHPFDDPMLTGFDVRGIAIFQGTHFFSEHGVLVSRAEEDEYSIENADGYTELWSPALFPTGWIGRPLFEYTKGKYALHGPNLQTTLNPFKAFHTLAERHTFQASGTDTRTYEIHFPDGVPLEFGYAIDASYAKPANAPNPDVPDDYPLQANSLEAYRIEAVQNGLLTPAGGSINLTIRIYDWQGPDTIDQVQVEVVELFNGFVNATFDSFSGVYAEYKATINNTLKAPPGIYPMLVSATDTQNDFFVGDKLGELRAYMVFDVEVSPLLEKEDTILLDNVPIQGDFNSVDNTCYFAPAPGTAGSTIYGIDTNLNLVDGYPAIPIVTGGMGICHNVQLIYLVTDLGGDDDITTYSIGTKAKDFSFNIASLFSNPSTGPIDFVINDNFLEVYTSLFWENQVAVYTGGQSAPDITVIDVGTSPTTMVLDNTNNRVFVACDGTDTIHRIDGFTKENTGSVKLANPLDSPIVDVPATPGLAYVPSTDELYVGMLLAGVIEVYDATGLTFKKSIAVGGGNYAIVGLLYSPETGYLYATGQTTDPLIGACWVINIATGKVLYQADTSAYNPSFMDYDSVKRRLFIPDPAGVVDVYKMN